jgi:2-dehydro-3-deoxygluconokinase
MQRAAEVVYDRAGSVFAITPPGHYDWPRLLQGARWLHLSGINLALGEPTTRASLDAVQAARAAGVQISFDCNHRATLWGTRAAQAPHLLREILAEADLVFGNERDIALALGLEVATGDAQARFTTAAGLAFAALRRLRWLATTTRQSSDADHQQLGGLLATREGQRATRLHRLTGIVDRIGSGDAFAAGLLHGLLRDQDEQQALEFATAAACLKHSLPGDVNLLGEADVLAWLSQDGFDVRR